MRLATALLLTAAPALLAADAARTVIVVRHAERASSAVTSDVPISEAGKCRANKLAQMLADAKVTSIFTSEVTRTQQTAEPLATKLGIKPEAIAGKDVAGLVQRLKTGQGVALVVGHSNTVPEIVNALGGGPAAAMPDDEFDRLYVVTLTAGQASATLIRYAGCAP